MTRVVLFDLDGTLIDSSAGIFASMAHAFTRMGAAVPPPERLRSYIGPPLRQSFRRRGWNAHSEQLIATAPTTPIA